MKIETEFSIGDEVYGIQKPYITDRWQFFGPLTIGQIRVEITDSPGIESETIFDNYKAQNSTKEGYMCIEAGIGSGTVHQVGDLFSDKELARAEAVRRNQEGEKNDN